MKKELYEEYFNHRKVTVMGLGLLGRGIGDTAFLAEHELELVVTDKKTQEELAPSLEALKEYPSIIYHLGGHQQSDFEQRDFILKAAGVPRESEFILHAKEYKIPVYMSAALVSSIVSKKVSGVTLIGVTGTRGKTTVTQMIAYVLRHAGYRVHVGGNVRGVANLPLLKEIEEGDYVVMELDSWQLQGFGDMQLSPEIAVLTSFLDDHMNYYHNDKEAYFNDKANIYRHQSRNGILIASEQAEKEIRKREAVPVTVPDRGHFAMKLIGHHNQVAANLAYEAAYQCGVSDEMIRESLSHFPGVEGRLQDLGVFGEKKVRIFNDNNATTPDATVAAIEAITEECRKKPIVILGGSDKGLPLTKLEEMLLILAKQTIFLDGTGTSRVNLPKEYMYSTLSECLTKAMFLASEGDIIIFSPGFASFGKEFNNEYERNDMFLSLVEKLR